MMSGERLSVRVVRAMDRRWVVEYAGMWLATDQPSRRAAVSAARRIVAPHVSAGGLVQIVIHDAFGEIVGDVTLPRSSDPRRSRG